MAFDSNGIDLSNWKETLLKGEETSLNAFFENVKKRNLRNSIFVDNTASEQVAQTYAWYLKIASR